MKITQNNIGDLSATLTLLIEKNDYEPRVKKNLNDYRRKAEIKGFRTGMAPMSMIEKVHGKTALLDEINKIMSESLNKYVADNNLNLLGEPIPSESEQKPIDWDGGGDFEFVFEIGMAPKIEFTLTEKDKIPYYKIAVSEEDKEKYKENILRQNGKLEDVDAIEEEDFIKADLEQGERKIEDSYISLKVIPTKTLKKPFIGKKVGDELTVDVKKTFTNETDLAALLKIKKEELAEIEPKFKITIKEVKRMAPAVADQELYDKLFGKDVVKSDEEFMQKLEDKIREEYSHESEYRFTVDAYNALLKKTKIELPDEFLKRWLNYSNEGKITQEMIDKEYPLFADDLRRQMIRGYILKEQKIELKHEDLLDHARKMASYQFSMYGIHNAPEEHLTHYANSILANEKELKRIYEKVESDKVIEYVKATVKLDEKEITIENLQKMYESEKEQEAK